MRRSSTTKSQANASEYRIDPTKLPGHRQEDIATAVALSEDKNASWLANQIDDLTLFDQPYDDIVSRCLEYRKKYGNAPGRTHLDGVFAHVLDDPNHKQYKTYDRILNGML